MLRMKGSSCRRNAAGRISRPRNPGRSTKMLSATLNPSTRQLLAWMTLMRL